MKRLSILLAAALLFGCSKGAPIVNFDNQQIKRFDSKVLSDEEIQQRIRKAADRQGWKVEPGEPGHVIATITVRNLHTAVVDISYERTKYSIHYKSSSNLLIDRTSPLPNDTAETGKPLKIHPNYNKWVSNLNDEIYKQLQE